MDHGCVCSGLILFWRRTCLSSAASPALASRFMNFPSQPVPSATGDHRCGGAESQVVAEGVRHECRIHSSLGIKTLEQVFVEGGQALSVAVAVAAPVKDLPVL